MTDTFDPYDDPFVGERSSGPIAMYIELSDDYKRMELPSGPWNEIFATGDPIKEIQEHPEMDIQLLEASLPYILYLVEWRKDIEYIAELLSLLKRRFTEKSHVSTKWQETATHIISTFVCSPNYHCEVQDMECGLRLQEVCDVPVTEKMRNNMAKWIPAFFRSKPEDISRFVRAFGITNEMLEKKVDEFISDVQPYQVLAREGIFSFSPEELDRKVQSLIIQAIEFDHGNKVPRMQSAFHLDQAPLDEAVLQGYCNAIKRKKPAEELLRIERECGIPINRKHPLFIKCLSDTCYELLRQQRSNLEDLSEYVRVFRLDFSEDVRMQESAFNFLRTICKFNDVHSYLRLVAIKNLGIFSIQKFETIVTQFLIKNFKEDPIDLELTKLVYADISTTSVRRDLHLAAEQHVITKLQEGDLQTMWQLEDALGHFDKIEALENHTLAVEGITNAMKREPFDITPYQERFRFTDAEIRQCKHEALLHFMQNGHVAHLLSMRDLYSLTDREISSALCETLLSSDEKTILNGLHVSLEMPEGALKTADSATHIFGYVNDMGIPSVAIYKQYTKLISSGDRIQLQGFVHSIDEQKREITGCREQKSSIQKGEYYKEIVQTVFPNNAGTWYTFDSAESCLDRSSDLAQYSIRDAYTFSIADGLQMQLKEGATKDDNALQKVESPIADVQRSFAAASVDFDPEKMLQKLDSQIEDLLKGNENVAACSTREDKLFLLLLESMINPSDSDNLKKLMIGYQFAVFEDIRTYLQGTRDRAANAKNQDYAYLIELREFFADHLKEVSRTVVKKALENPAIQALMPEYFQKKSAFERERIHGETANRMQVDKLGMSDGFIKQLARTLSGKTGREYSLEKVREIVTRYERRMQSHTIEPQKKRSMAFHGQLVSQRKKTFDAIRELTGESLDPATISLGDLNLAEYMQARENSLKGEFNEDLFGKYVAHAFQDVYSNDLSLIDQEIAKYHPADEQSRGKQMRKVRCVITKNHTSAHARGTAGVCVSGDNPNKDAKCQWNLPGYFQMNIHDANTQICQGCVLLHMEELDGKKILTASINPSSTYLFKVDEHQMFKGLVHQLVQFCTDNAIDMIAVSKNSQIRTNRTGGEFENAMNQMILEVDQELSFPEERRFSFSPSYQQKDMSVLWKNPQIEGKA